MSHRVFIASTFLDNEERRKLVRDAVIELGMVPVGMEWFTAEPHPPKDVCIEAVRSCDVTVVIIALRYGWAPEGDSRSITEIEFDESKQRLVFMLEKRPVDEDRDYDSGADRWKKREQLDAFKAKVQTTKGCTCAEFSETTLKSGVQSALRKWRGDASPHAPTTTPAWSTADALAAYRSWAAKQHERLVPYFEGASDTLLESVFVQVDLEPTRTHSETGPGMDLGGEKRGDAYEPRTLEQLLLQCDIPAQATRWIIVGEPGAGKTTLERSLTRSMALSGARVPIFVPLVGCKSALAPIEYAVADMLGADALHSARGQVLKEALRHADLDGNLIVLLDGLDEVEPDQIDALLERIAAFAEEHPRAALAVSTRPIALERRDVPKTFRRARVTPLPRERQDELLAKFLKPDEARRVREHIDVHPTLAELASSPLLLTLLAVVARDTVLAESSLPATRTRLYEKAIDLLLRRGFGVKKTGVSDRRGVRDPEQGRRVLQKLSLRLHERGGEGWDRKVLSEELDALRMSDGSTNFIINETWKTNSAFLDDIGGNSGVLGLHDGQGLPWRYLHRSLREFLAAEEVARETDSQIDARLKSWAEATDAWKKAHEGQDDPASSHDGVPNPARWGEVFALVAGLRTKPAALLDALANTSADLALRTLPSIDALPPRDVLQRFVRIERWNDDQFEGWKPEQMLLILTRWNVLGEKAAKLVSAVIAPGLSNQILGQLWFVLESLGAVPTREAFFTQAGRTLPDSDYLSWCAIRAGTFTMGSGDSGPWKDEGPAHSVQVPRFELATTVVTREQYRRFDDGKTFTEGSLAAGQDGRLPATDVSWYEALAFCAWIGARLPTEAEWEYACRAGTTSAYSFGDNAAKLKDHAWYFVNSGKQLLPDNTQWNKDKWWGEWGCRVHPVGKKPANPWGLLDMHGNAFEWCRDTWHADYNGAPTDGSAWVDTASSFRVIRGGSFVGSALFARSACRLWTPPSFRWRALGFRPARYVTS